jgi:tRNA(Ile)-lysidine synthetase-like protein
MQRIEGLMRRAIEDYSMIEEGDKIAVALSGGKDSIALLYALKNLQRYHDKKFDLLAISANPGFEGFNEEIIKKICDNINVEVKIENVSIKQIVFDERKEKNPCSLCANLRRGVLNNAAKKYGCNKIALGHNEDDVLETFLMNMIYAGNIGTFSPITYMNRSDMTLIRPLIYVPEKLTKRFIKKYEIEILDKVCPIDGTTKRQFALDLLKQLEKTNKQTRANLMGAIKRANLNGWKEFK